jgi:hypothetical protein
MREIEHRYNANSRPPLQRGADGHIKPAGEERDIADIWAERDRIRLSDAITADQAKAVKRQRRTKEIEIKIRMPKVNLRHALKCIRGRLPRLSRQQWAWAAVIGVILVFLVGTKGVYSHLGQKRADKARSHALASAPKGGDHPQFATVLPKGKTIDQLGGWGRVSPPDKDPVFGYSDTLSGQHVVVSEQPLPDSFLKDAPGQMALLAKQLGANQQLITTGNTVVYVGVSSTGVQSAVAIKLGLLILIRSAGAVSNNAWTDYVASLQ